LKLIKIENVQFKKDELGTTYADADNLESINHIIVDDNNRSLIVRVSGYAQFARDSLPTGNGTIVGVLEKYDDDYQFMIRNADDVDFNGERFVQMVGLLRLLQALIIGNLELKVLITVMLNVLIMMAQIIMQMKLGIFLQK